MTTVINYETNVANVGKGQRLGITQMFHFLRFSCPIPFFFYVNDLPYAVQNSRVACFADDIMIFRRVDFTFDAALLQRNQSNLENWSSTNGLVFNQLKGKCLRVTRKNQPVTYSYKIKDKALSTTSVEKDLGI